MVTVALATNVAEFTRCINFFGIFWMHPGPGTGFEHFRSIRICEALLNTSDLFGVVDWIISNDFNKSDILTES